MYLYGYNYFYVVLVNKNFCKNSKNIMSDDSFYLELFVLSITNNKIRFSFIFIFVDKFSRLNIHGIAVAYAEFNSSSFSPSRL